MVGIVAHRSNALKGMGTTAVFDLPTAQRLVDKQGKLDEIEITAKDGVSAEALTKEIRPLLPQNAQARTADAQVEQASRDTAHSLGSFRTVPSERPTSGDAAPSTSTPARFNCESSRPRKRS